MNSQGRNSREPKLLAIKSCVQTWKFYDKQSSPFCSLNNMRQKKESDNGRNPIIKLTFKLTQSNNVINLSHKGVENKGHYKGKCSKPLIKEKFPETTKNLLLRSNKELNVYGLKQKEKEFFQNTANHDFGLPQITRNSYLKKRYIRLITKKTVKEEFPLIKPIVITERKGRNQRKSYLDNDSSIKKITVTKRMKKWPNYTRQGSTDKISELCKKINDILAYDK